MQTVDVYGTPTTRERATAWAAARGFTLVSRGTMCAHALRKRPCPSTTRYDECSWASSAAFDHGRIWQRRDGTRFILAHIYAGSDASAALADAEPIARERGLTVVVDPSMDWYGAGTIPLRYELPT